MAEKVNFRITWNGKSKLGGADMFIPEIPNNSLKNEINEIVDIAVKLEDIKKSVFNPPAADNEIAALEKLINYSLPVEYKDFLRFSNGMIMNNHSADFWEIDRIINYYLLDKAEWFPTDYIVIAEIVGDGEILCISSVSGKFVRYFDGEETFYDSFKEALKSIIDHIKEVDEDYLLED